MSGQVGAGSNAAIAVAASRAIGATLEVLLSVWLSLSAEIGAKHFSERM